MHMYIPTVQVHIMLNKYIYNITVDLWGVHPPSLDHIMNA